MIITTLTSAQSTQMLRSLLLILDTLLSQIVSIYINTTVVGCDILHGAENKCVDLAPNCLMNWVRTKLCKAGTGLGILSQESVSNDLGVSLACQNISRSLVMRWARSMLAHNRNRSCHTARERGVLYILWQLRVISSHRRN